MKAIPQYRALWRKIKEVPDRQVVVYCPPELRKRVQKALRNERAIDSQLVNRNFYRLMFRNETGATFTAIWESLPAAHCYGALNEPTPVFFETTNIDNEVQINERTDK